MSGNLVRAHVPLVKALALAVVLIASAFHLQAQTVTGSILGNVQDSSGSAVPNVEITIVNQDTGVERVTAGTAEGIYNVPSLAAGRYTVGAKAVGFSPVEVKDVVVRVGSDARVDLKLTVGQITQQVTVTEAIPTVETTSSEVSQIMSEEIIQQIPLNARDVQQLAVVQPGVQFMNTGFGGRAMTVAGDRPTNNRFLQEGMDLNWTYRLSPISLPSNVLLGVEAVKEFKVLTTNFTAEYGEQSGGIINTLFKSGTNTLHGSAYEFYRNAALDARNFFDQGPAPPFRRHQFGGSLGGPIRKDKTFFFRKLRRVSIQLVSVIRRKFPQRCRARNRRRRKRAASVRSDDGGLRNQSKWHAGYVSRLHGYLQDIFRRGQSAFPQLQWAGGRRGAMPVVQQSFANDFRELRFGQNRSQLWFQKYLVGPLQPGSVLAIFAGTNRRHRR